MVTIEARVYDAGGIQCLDARNSVRFSITRDGELIDNLGTSDGSRSIQLYNGRAIISIKKNHGASIASVSSHGLPTVFIEIEE